MTDDIVARLRDQEEFGLLGVPGDHRCVSYGDAADEIERLRAVLACISVASEPHRHAPTYTTEHLQGVIDAIKTRACAALTGGKNG